MAALPAGFLEQTHVFDDDTFVDRFEHVVEGERRDAHGNHRLHLNTSLSARSRARLDDERFVVLPGESHIDVREWKRMRERNQRTGLLRGHDPRDLRGGKGVTFAERRFVDRAPDARTDANARLRTRGTYRDALPGDIDHRNAAVGRYV